VSLLRLSGYRGQAGLREQRSDDRRQIEKIGRYSLQSDLKVNVLSQKQTALTYT